jgi:cyclin B
MLRMIRSARNRLHRESVTDNGERSSGARSGVETESVFSRGANSVEALYAAASRRRSECFSRTRPSLGQTSGFENTTSDNMQLSFAPASILGDATNTYYTGQRVPETTDATGTLKSSAIEKRFIQLEAPSGERDSDAMVSSRKNPQDVMEYAQEILQKMKAEEPVLLTPPTYMDSQVHLNTKMRAILLDWLVDVHKKYKLQSTTLFLAAQVIDRYLEIHVIAKNLLQLVGVTALMIAAKFEEVYPPQIKEFVNITDKAYSKDEILKMEVSILQALQFKVCRPTAMHFLDRYQCANECTDSHRDLAQYILELSLVEYKMLKYPPSHQAAASILLSNKLLRKASWAPAVAKLTKMTEPMLKECAKEMCAVLESVENSSLQAVRRKFSQAKYHSVAKLNFMVVPATQTGTASSARTARRSTGGAAELA